MDIIGAKVVVLFLMLVLQVLPGLVPMLLRSRLKQRRANLLEKLIGAVLCIGGGVLLATVFIHMVPEVRETLTRAATLGVLPDEHYPFAELSICLGYLAVYFVEALVHKLMGGSAGHGHSHGGGGGDGRHEHRAECRENSGFDREEPKPNNPEDGGDEDKANSSRDLTATTIETAWSKGGSSKSDQRQSSLGKLLLGKVRHPLSRASAAYNVSSATLTSYQSDGLEFGPDPRAVAAAEAAEAASSAKTKGNASKEETAVATVRNFVFVIAMSTHNVFEGMAIGLQLEVGDVWKLFLAVLWHSIVILFCIGTDMLAARTRKLFIVLYVTLISIMSPIGIIIGLLVTENVDKGSGTQAATIGLLQGIAGGTLLYVTFTEMLDRQRLAKSGMDGMLGFFFICVGFILMVAAEAAGGHSHDHGYEDTGSQMGHGHGHGHVGDEGPPLDHHGHGHAHRSPDPVHNDTLNRLDSSVQSALARDDFASSHNHSLDHDLPDHDQGHLDQDQDHRVLADSKTSVAHDDPDHDHKSHNHGHNHYDHYHHAHGNYSYHHHHLDHNDLDKGHYHDYDSDQDHEHDHNGDNVHNYDTDTKSDREEYDPITSIPGSFDQTNKSTTNAPNLRAKNNVVGHNEDPDYSEQGPDHKDHTHVASARSTSKPQHDTHDHINSTFEHSHDNMTKLNDHDNDQHHSTRAGHKSEDDDHNDNSTANVSIAQAQKKTELHDHPEDQDRMHDDHDDRYKSSEPVVAPTMATSINDHYDDHAPNITSGTSADQTNNPHSK